ncbi:MAG: tripartite tricarboxylate transporter substrate binding protein [Stomatobaculum sp.]|nr:tripartite tricarboxylate transporter substrate binding protein [Stomatobaculum sp.]
MIRINRRNVIKLLLAAGMTALLASCGGSGAAGTTAGSTETTAAAQTGGSETAAESAAPAAAAVDYPKKSITMIIPYGAGGTTDLVGRQLAIALEKQLKQSIVVENVPGASGSVGTETALQAEPDGYTLLLTADSLGTQRVMGISEMSYNDFSPILPIANDPKVMVVAKDSEYETIQDLLDAMKEKPGKIKMSYTGPGGSGHIQALLLNRYGYEPSMTAYNSGAEGITAVLGHQVDFTNSNYSTVASYIESGDLRLLAVCSVDPLPAHPEAVTLASVMEGSEEMMSMPYTPLSLIVNKDVPEDVKEVLRTAAKAAVKDPEFEKYMDDNCIEKLYEKYETVEDAEKFFAEWESEISWMLYDAGAAVKSPEEFGIPKP